MPVPHSSIYTELFVLRNRIMKMFGEYRCRMDEFKTVKGKILIIVYHFFGHLAIKVISVSLVQVVHTGCKRFYGNIADQLKDKGMKSKWSRIGYRFKFVIRATWVSKCHHP